MILCVQCYFASTKQSIDYPNSYDFVCVLMICMILLIELCWFQFNNTVYLMYSTEQGRFFACSFGRVQNGVKCAFSVVESIAQSPSHRTSSYS
jgi:hypothetical protein